MTDDATIRRYKFAVEQEPDRIVRSHLVAHLLMARRSWIPHGPGC